MKKFLITVLCFITAFSCVSFADSGVNVIINGNKTEFDVPPKIINNRTMVPMRKIFETLGANVEWVSEAQLIIATKGIKIIAMEIGQNSFSITDITTGVTETVELDVPPQIVDSRTLVPVRAISEALDMNVGWEAETQTVIINNIQE